MIYIQLINLI